MANLDDAFRLVMIGNLGPVEYYPHLGKVRMIVTPYDEGWTVTVDGKEAITRPVWKAFTGVELTAGTHTVELRYYPQGLHEGLLISGGALFVLVVIVASMYIRKKKHGKTSAK